MTSFACNVRDTISAFMSHLPIPDRDGRESREEPGFNKFWCIRGDHLQGVFASYTDRDDVIEFGLFERGSVVGINHLHVAVVLDDNEVEMLCASEVNTEMNFNTAITPEKQECLISTLKFFGENLRNMTV